MNHLHLVRPIVSTPRPDEKRPAKVIALEARREARRAERRLSRPLRPDAA